MPGEKATARQPKRNNTKSIRSQYLGVSRDLFWSVWSSLNQPLLKSTHRVMIYQAAVRTLSSADALQLWGRKVTNASEGTLKNNHIPKVDGGWGWGPGEKAITLRWVKSHWEKKKSWGQLCPINFSGTILPYVGLDKGSVLLRRNDINVTSCPQFQRVTLCCSQ